MRKSRFFLRCLLGCGCEIYSHCSLHLSCAIISKAKQNDYSSYYISYIIYYTRERAPIPSDRLAGRSPQKSSRSRRLESLSASEPRGVYTQSDVVQSGKLAKSSRVSLHLLLLHDSSRAAASGFPEPTHNTRRRAVSRLVRPVDSDLDRERARTSSDKRRA